MKNKNLKKTISHLKTNARVSAEELSKILADDQSLITANLLILGVDIHVLSSECVLTIYKIFNETKGIKTIRSSIWGKRDSNWKLFFHQETKMY
ncbi:DUF4440 domain-containing protein [Bacillus thuringiensis]|uniref:DUF4440 domain-containing protein n=1 Tax=Bacillus thuringiensis TaxID=1428 RepID=UPI0022252877|nr:DUF4440 domain-containing protein [Bacillus thuringiensis]UYX52207.1 DUF4440 domain-containing protein [Bacillus thuringiensis]